MVFRFFTAVLFALGLSACVSTPEDSRPPGVERCESFFIYVLCISDLDADGRVDYMYFDDTREIFMYADSLLNELETVLPLHACAIPMSESTRDLSSQLLYSDDIGLSARLAVKAKLAVSYRAAQPAVDACNAALNPSTQTPAAEERPFDDDDDWLEEPE
ncbi:hypothetical protein [Congregibacter litoralis]|uniref:Lipoprotein n=1 Tax=Congregibacter litoralis KT71 TaxID=314285 RepID=A4AA68_9GAMM|nr:hypothetical protein [Congregibacter litoralis]EAQ96945.1 hypothetical protein KT71_11820 [Congregibacter litoralis KT71]